MIGQKHQTNYFTIFFLQYKSLQDYHFCHSLFFLLLYFSIHASIHFQPPLSVVAGVYPFPGSCPVLGRGRTYTLDKFSVCQLIPGQKETETLEWLLSRTSVSLERGRKRVRMVQMQHKILQPLCNSTSHCTTMLPSYIKHHEHFTGTFTVTLS